MYRLSDDLAVVLTTDFFTPIVDDPYWYGAIAAANSLSDIYAMGAKPLVALNIAMFPNQKEFFPYLKKIMQGGIDKMTEAGVSIIGGHTIRDKEPKFGFAVLGTIHPEEILDNSKAISGDALILTKKIGSGIISTGVKANMCSDAVIEEFTNSMSALNKKAGEIMLKIGISTATDITGFGLLGHLSEVLAASKTTAHLYSDRVPFFTDAVRLAEMRKVPGGSIANLRSFEQYVIWNNETPETMKFLLNDAQTSGGLLIFVPQGKKDKLVSALQRENIIAAHVGDVTGEDLPGGKRIFVH